MVEAIRAGNDAPIYDIYKLHRNEFISWARKNFKATNEQAKDAFQESVLDFYQNVKSGQLSHLTSELKTYLFQIGKYKLLNVKKKEARLTYLDVLQVIEGGELETFMEEENNAYNKEQISRAIEGLPEDCKKVLKLFYFQEYDMESIAREMGYANSATAKSKKALCMKKLMVELKKLTSVLVL